MTLVSPDDVTVEAPARLHLGFLDLNYGLGRKFGSFGVALEAPVTRLRLRPGRGLVVEGPEQARTLAHLRRLASHFGARPDFAVTIERAIPAHAGLGSGTQLALGLGAVFCRATGHRADSAALAALLGRGARSGVGVGVFDRGGLLVDGGKGAGEGPAPIIAAHPFPPQWRILLIFDRAMQGVHGQQEKAAFRRLRPFPAATAAHLCRLAVMKMLPALVEADLDGFGAAVAEMQRHIGDHFAPFQGGRRFASPDVAKILAWLEQRGIVGLGQSSWGPTGFAFVAGAEQGQDLLDALQKQWSGQAHIGFMLTAGRNRGASLGGRACRLAAPEASR